MTYQESDEPTMADLCNSWVDHINDIQPLILALKEYGLTFGEAMIVLEVSSLKNVIIMSNDRSEGDNWKDDD